MAEAGCLRDVAVQNLEINGNTTTTGNLIVNGALSNSIFGKRDYVFRMTANAAVDPADSIVLIATGFLTGHHVIETVICVNVTPTANLGAVAFEIGTLAQCTRDAVGGTAINNAATVADTTNAVVMVKGANPTNATASFVTGANNSNSLCISAAAGNVAVIDGDVTFVATVLSANGTALPAPATTATAGHTIA